MELFSKLPPELRNARISQIDNRWKQLNELEKESAGEGVKYLLLVNSGGAVATLSFIGAIGKHQISFLPKLSLACFILGVLFVGVSKAIEFHHMTWLYREWRDGVNCFFQDQTSWAELSAADDKRATTRLLHLTFPYGSFVCFIVGSSFGFWALL